MTRKLREIRRDYNDLLNFSRQFAKEEDGLITVFALFMIFMMMMVAGIGVDMMRHEMERTRVQGVADRAVLAAADLDQTLDPEAVVRDYFTKSGMEEFVSAVDVDQGVNFRTVTVEAESVFPTMFMSYTTPWAHRDAEEYGVKSLSVPAASTAEEKVNKVEISLVLDISGSMRHNGKMANLRDAAAVFVDTVLKEENRDLISVNVVPYTAQVNAGRDIFELMETDRNTLPESQRHDYSWCVDFLDEDFDDTSIYADGEGARSEPYKHMQHFEASSSWYGNYTSQQHDRIQNPGCPNEDFEEIQAYSQTPSEIKANIDQFEPRANTSIHLGMKWGVAMLDPAWRSFNADLPNVDPAFSDRPSDYGDTETLKTVVLMTDGVNVNTRRIKDSWYRNNIQLWGNIPLYAVINRTSYDFDDLAEIKYYASDADDLLENICDAAKEERIVIWSIGFEVNDHGADVMRNCASSPSHFFRVEGIEITEAFESIARQINQLRLTQ